MDHLAHARDFLQQRHRLRGFQFDLDPHRASGAQLRNQVLRCFAGTDFATIDDDDAVAHQLDLTQDVCRKQDRVRQPELLDQVAHAPDLVRVEAVGRLVEDQQLGLMHEGIGEADALPVALREVADDLLAHLVQAAHLHHLADVLAQFTPREPLQRGPEIQIFPHPHVRVQRHVLRHVADAAAGCQRLVENVESSHRSRARGGREVAGEHADRRCFASSIRPEKSHHFTAPDFETDVIYGRPADVAFGEILNLYHRGMLRRCLGETWGFMRSWSRRHAQNPTDGSGIRSRGHAVKV